MLKPSGGSAQSVDESIKEEKEVRILRTDAENAPATFSAEQQEALKLFKAKIEAAKLTCKELESGLFQLDDRMLLRFLIARDFKVDKAFDMLKAHFAWRDEVMPMSLGEKELPATFNCGVLRYVGPSKFGTSTNISLSSFFEPSDYTVEEYAKYVAYACERSIRLMDESKSTQSIWVFDLEGWSLFKHGGYKPTMMVKALIETSQDHYPERLAKAIIVNAPWVFQGFWKVIRPFIDAKTQVKVQFGPPSCLVDFIDPKFLPKKYGGTLEGDIPVHPHGTRPHGLAHSHTT